MDIPQRRALVRAPSSAIPSPVRCQGKGSTYLGSGKLIYLYLVSSHVHSRMKLWLFSSINFNCARTLNIGSKEETTINGLVDVAAASRARGPGVCQGHRRTK